MRKTAFRLFAGMACLAGVAIAASTAARADCAETFTGSNVVICAPPGTNGFTAGGDGIDVTVQRNAITDSILLNNSSTVVNNGSILPALGTPGISALDNNQIVNNGFIIGGDFTAGVIAQNDNSPFSGLPTSGIFNYGRIVTGNNSFGVFVQDRNLINNFGTISAGDNSTAVTLGFVPGTGNDNVINNFGTISAGATSNAIAVGGANNVINNYGSILGGIGSFGIQLADDGNVVNNFGLIRVTGSGFAIEGCFCAGTNSQVNNSGTIDGMISFTAGGNVVTNNGLITITDPATPVGGPTPGQTHILNNASGFGAPNVFEQSASGTLELRMDATGLNDNLLADVVRPVAGSTMGTLRIAIQPGLYANQTTSLFSAVGLTGIGPGNITSPFDRYVSTSPFFTVTPLYSGGSATPVDYTDVNIQLDRVAFNAVPGMTPNQRAIGNALEPAYSGALTENAATLFSNLFAAKSLAVLDLLSGEGASATQGAAFGSGSLFNNAMFNQGGAGGFTMAPPLQYAPSKLKKPRTNAFAAVKPQGEPEESRWRAWASGFGATRTVDGETATGSATQSVRTGGGSFGLDRQINPDMLAGFAVGGSYSKFSVSERATGGEVAGGHIGGYTRNTWGALYLATAVSFAHFENETYRTITGVGSTEIAKGKFGSNQIGSRFEAGYRQAYTSYSITPFVAIEPAQLWQSGYTETTTDANGNPGVLGLAYQSRAVTSLPSFLGAQFDTRYAFANGAVATPYARASWVHEFYPERQISAAFVSVPAASFTVDGARAATDAVRIDTGAKVLLTPATSLFMNLNTEHSERSRSYAGTAGLRSVW